MEGKEYVQYCRRLISDSQKVPSVHDTMPTRPEAPLEHVILDENIKAQHHQYYSIGAFKVRSYHYYGIFFLTFFHFVSQLPTCLYFISKFISFQVSPNNKLVAYAEDTKGDEIYTVYVIDAETQAPIGEPLVGVTSYLGWAGDDALVYITMDNILRPDKVGNSPLDQVFNCFVLISAFLFNNNNNHQSFHDFTKILFWSTFRSNY